MFPFDSLLDYFLGALAASVRIAIGHERGEKITKTRIYITAVSSIVMAGTGGKPLAAYAHLPEEMGHMIAFILALFAVGLVYQIYDGKVTLPVLGQIFKPTDKASNGEKQ